MPGEQAVQDDAPAGAGPARQPQPLDSRQPTVARHPMLCEIETMQASGMPSPLMLSTNTSQISYKIEKSFIDVFYHLTGTTSQATPQGRRHKRAGQGSN